MLLKRQGPTIDGDQCSNRSTFQDVMGFRTVSNMTRSLQNGARYVPLCVQFAFHAQPKHAIRERVSSSTTQSRDNWQYHTYLVLFSYIGDVS